MTGTSGHFELERGNAHTAYITRDAPVPSISPHIATMAIQLTGHNIDLEAQPVPLKLPEVGGSTTQETVMHSSSRISHMNSDIIPARPASPSLEVNSVAQPAVPQEDAPTISLLHRISPSQTVPCQLDKQGAGEARFTK